MAVSFVLLPSSLFPLPPPPARGVGPTGGGYTLVGGIYPRPTETLVVHHAHDKDKDNVPHYLLAIEPLAAPGVEPPLHVLNLLETLLV